MSHPRPRTFALALLLPVACAGPPDGADPAAPPGSSATDPDDGDTTDADPDAAEPEGPGATDPGDDTTSDASSGDPSPGATDGGSTHVQPPGTWIAIPAGAFVMGAPPSDPCPVSSANDHAHAVTLTAAFEISATEVTQAEYAAVLGEPHPWATACDDCPLAMVTWHEAAAVCNAWSDFAGLPPCYRCEGQGTDQVCTAASSPYDCAGYRLPTEAEWEYAARAGETHGAHGGPIEICESADPRLDTLGWYLFNADGGTHPVASKLANAWGLFDTIGNVWEWTHDGYVQDLSTVAGTDPWVESADGLRVMRGGSYNCTPAEVRLAHRSGLPAAIAGLNVGLRCARTL